MTLTVTYSDGSTQTVSSGFTCDKTTLSEGDTAVNVTFEGFTARFSVTVNKVSNLLASGTYGSNITWELTKDGTLTLTGYGDMPDTTEEEYKSQQPWFSYRNSIVRVVISQGITGIGDCAFINCGAMTQITIPGSVARIGKNAFSDCSGLPQITLPDSVTAIGEYAFAGCYNLTQINIPHGVTVIERGTFFTCTALEQVEIPDSVETVKDSAFLSSGVTQVTVLNKDCQIETDYGTTLGDAGTTTIRGYTGSTAETYAQKYGFTFEALDGAGGETTVPSGTYGENITWELRDGTLTLAGTGDMPDAASESEVPWQPYCKDIHTVQIGEGITNIGDYAFYGCSVIAQVNMPDSATRIGNYAFFGCNSLAQINIPGSIAAIGDYAFLECFSLTQFDIPDGVTTIGERVFENCTGLTQVSIPDSVVTIRSNAFRGCSGLTQIQIPDSISTIESWAFCGCSGLVEITIPGSIANIDVSTFHKCSSLEKITILNKDCTIYDAENTLGIPGTTTVRGYKGSTAETYAQKYGYTFEALD